MKTNSSAAVANTGKQTGTLSATPEWTFKCGGQGSTNCSGMVGAFNTMRVFTENGVEKIASTFRLPKSAVITLNASNGTEDRFAKTNNKGQGSPDSFLQRLLCQRTVEFDP